MGRVGGFTSTILPSIFSVLPDPRHGEGEEDGESGAEEKAGEEDSR